MKSALAIFVAALATSALLTPMVRRFALRIGAYDEPNERRIHTRRIPRLGGLAVVAGFFVSLLVIFALEQASLGRMLARQPNLVVALFAGGLGAAVLGVVDDLRGVRAIHKLVVQVGVAVLAYSLGFRVDAIDLPWFGVVRFGAFGVLVTVFWFVAVMNAVNLIDGLDGLAGGIAFVACVSNFVVGYLNDALLVVLLSAALAGAVLGFLIYNFNPASIFLGDTGSLFLGFVLAATSLLGSSVKSSTTVALLVPILALGVPIMDTLFAMVRRWLERRPMFSPDRGHIHHKLLDLGLTHRRAVLTLYGISIVLAGGAITVAAGQSWEVGVALFVVSVVVVGFVRAARLFAGVRPRREVLPPHSAFVQRLVDELVVTVAEIASSQDDSERERCLARLVQRAGFAAASFESAAGWKWSVDARSAARGRARLSVVSRNGAVTAHFEVDEETSSRGQLAALLQVVVESVARHHPAPMADAAKAKEQSGAFVAVVH